MAWDKLWQATGFGSSIQQTTDGGYVIAGTKDSSGGNSHIWLIKLRDTESSGTPTSISGTEKQMPPPPHHKG